MGVIRWEEIKGGPDNDDVMWHGYLADDCICFVADFGRDKNGNGGWSLFTHQEFPGLLHGECHSSCVNLEHGKAMAQQLLHSWMIEVGLVPKAEYDRLNVQVNQLSWEVANAKRERDIAEARYEALRAPKQRTEADFRNADIDANFYVTFRDVGAA